MLELLQGQDGCPNGTKQCQIAGTTPHSCSAGSSLCLRALQKRAETPFFRADPSPDVPRTGSCSARFVVSQPALESIEVDCSWLVLQSTPIRRHLRKINSSLPPPATMRTLVEVHLSDTCSGIVVAPLQDCVHLRRLTLSRTSVMDGALASLLR